MNLTLSGENMYKMCLIENFEIFPNVEYISSRIIMKCLIKIILYNHWVEECQLPECW